MDCDTLKADAGRNRIYRFDSVPGAGHSYRKKHRGYSCVVGKKTAMRKGQISVMTALIAAGGMIIASAFTGWFSASNRVGMAETKISVVEEREQNRYVELKESLNRIETKLDKILLNGKNQSALPDKK